MTPEGEPIRYLRAANDDAETDIVPAHLAARRAERRMMAVVALLAVCVLGGAFSQGLSVITNFPSIVNNAFRV